MYIYPLRKDLRGKKGENMEALILDKNYQTLQIADAFDSFIWTDRYNEPGDFELYLPADEKILPYAVEDYYVWQEKSDRLMVIEAVNIETSAENGPHVTLSGRSAECFLERRVVAYRTVINGNLQDAVERLLNENVINPSDADRKIPGIRFIRNDDSRVTSLTCDLNLLGEYILDVIEDLCQTNNLGFKMTYNEENSTLDFMLYFGEDRSYQQEKNPWVVFSPGFDNLISSNYLKTSVNLRTAAVVGGDANYERGQEVIDVDGKPELKGLDRREMFVDGSDIELPNPTVNEESIRERLEKKGKEEEEIQAAIDAAMADALAQTTSVYRDQLRQKGLDELSKTYITESFEGEIEGKRQYKYGEDFFIGDVVQVLDSYGREASSRITEVVRSHDLSGEIMTPTFTTLVGGSNVHPDE